MLRGFATGRDERLLVGPQSLDDAGVVRLGEGSAASVRGALGELALVQTIDYFPPVVDDPWFYGAIAAANALSDVYAMGGRPHSALNLFGFPKDFPEAWIEGIHAGGRAKLAEAGCVLAGGHTVDSAEVWFGFAVTGLIEVERVVSNAGARVGDRLYLTKALGMGALTTAAKQRKLSWEQLRPAAEQMATLNRAASEAMLAAGASAATDVTGFGLAGHARNVADASEVTLRFEARALPLFAGVLELARAGTLSGGAKRGRLGLGESVRISEALEPALAALCFDAETSGGLLIAIAPERAPALERELLARDLPVHAVGEVLRRAAHAVELS